MISFSPKQLEVFIAIATLGSVRAAAQSLFLTQPAVSMALSELEKQLHSPLFDRDKGRLYLNSKGRDLLPISKEILARMTELQQRALETNLILQGDLRIGASNTVGNYLVGELLGEFLKDNELVTVHLEVANTNEIAEKILKHQLDIACVEGEVNHDDIESTPWLNDALVICAKPDHPLAQGTKKLKADQFSKERWILREIGSATRQLSERALAQLPPSQLIVMELGQTEAIKQAVIAGLGIAFLPQAAIGDALQTGRLAVLNTPFLNLNRQLSILRHKHTFRSRMVEEFLACCSKAKNA